MESFKTNFNFITNIIILTLLVLGGTIWADNNGVWIEASDVNGGTFGSDEGNPDFIFPGEINYNGQTLDNRFINVGETGDNILDNTIDSSEIQDNTLTNADIADGTIRNQELQDNSVNSAKVQDNTLTNNDIQSLAWNKILNRPPGLDDGDDVGSLSAFDCPVGQYAYGRNANGNLKCKSVFNLPSNVATGFKSFNTGVASDSLYGCVDVEITCSGTSNFCNVNWKKIGMYVFTSSMTSPWSSIGLNLGTSTVSKGGSAVQSPGQSHPIWSSSYFTCVVKWDASDNNIKAYGKFNNWVPYSTYQQYGQVNNGVVWATI